MPRLLRTPFAYRKARISFESGAAEFDSMYTVPLAEEPVAMLARSVPKAGAASIMPSAARDTDKRLASGTAEAYRPDATRLGGAALA
jgi:hypothetical protein